MSSLLVKICGITSAGDAEMAAEAGADAIGLNFVPGSPRRLDPAAAAVIAGALRGRVEVVGVVADLEDAAIQALIRDVGLDTVQLHGDEPPEQVERLRATTGRCIVKAVGVGSHEDVARALRYPGGLLVDAKVQGALGGTGQVADWTLAAELAAARRVILAGGLGPDNVAEAVARVRPAGVDVASGVERTPGVKDPDKVRAFVQRARGVAGVAQ